MVAAVLVHGDIQMPSCEYAIFAMFVLWPELSMDQL